MCSCCQVSQQIIAVPCVAPTFFARHHSCACCPLVLAHWLPTASRGPHSRSPIHASAFQHVTTCRACGSGALRRPVFSSFDCFVLSWRPIHPGQLEPTTLPLRRLAPVSCSEGLSPTLSLPISLALSCSLSPVAPLCSFPTVLYPLSLSFSLSLPLAQKKGVRVVRCISIPPRVRTILYGTEEVWCIHWATTIGYLHHALQSFSPACHPLSCVSSFAWGCAQQRVEEPHSVPGYRVRLPEERSLEQPQEVRSACQPHMHAISSSAHRGGHRSVSLCRRTVEDRLPLERVPLACTFGSPLDLHVRQSLRLQGPVDLDHHRVELLIAHQQWFPMVVHNLTVHPGVMWLVQSELDLLVAGPGHCGQLCFNCLQSFIRHGVQLTQCLHFETLAFLLRLDLLWGWLDVCVWAIPLLM